MQVHRDIMDGRFAAPPFAGAAPRLAWVAPGARIEAGVAIEGPCFVDDGTVVKAGARIGPYAVIGRQCQIEEDAHGRGVDRLGGHAGSAATPPCGSRSSGGTATWAGTPCSTAASCSATSRSSPTTAGSDGLSGADMTLRPVNPDIFKAYDIRGIYPASSTSGSRGTSAARSSPILEARRIAVTRDMRVSSPAIAAAFIDGARAQGADVVDYGLAGTDMLYFAVAADGFDGGAQITASHNPKQ